MILGGGAASVALAVRTPAAPPPATSAATNEAPPAGPPAREAEAPALPTALPAWASAFPSDDTLDDTTRDTIAHEARALAAVLPRGSSLRDELFVRITHAPVCGRAHAAVVAAVFAESSADEIEGALAGMKTSCDEVVVEGAGFAPAASDALAARLLRLAEQAPAATTRRAAWLSYGSVAETATRTGDAALGLAISKRIARALGEHGADTRALFVKTAGNAGCVACLPAIARDLHARDVALRSAAVAAHRFVDARTSVATMCGSLANDGDDAVRDMAAWALEWRGGSAPERAACLEKAARNDPSRRVRAQAVLALGVLADDHDSARGTLERLAAEPSLDVAALAERALGIRGADDTRHAPSPLLASLDD